MSLRSSFIKYRNLYGRRFFLWRQNLYARAVRFYVVEKTVYMATRKKKGAPPTLPPNSKLIITTDGSVIPNPKRQQIRKNQRDWEKRK